MSERRCYADGSLAAKLDNVAGALGEALRVDGVDAALVVLQTSVDFARFMQIAYTRGWDNRIDICLADSVEDKLVRSATEHGRAVVKIVTFDDVSEHINELSGPAQAAGSDASSEELTDVSAVPRPPNSERWRTMVLVHTRQSNTPAYVIEHCVQPAQEADAFCRAIYCGWPGDDDDDDDDDAGASAK